MTLLSADQVSGLMAGGSDHYGASSSAFRLPRRVANTELVDHPEEVEVRSVGIAIALRTIFVAAGMKRHMRVTAEILD
jgi:hypothetical protein